MEVLHYFKILKDKLLFFFLQRKPGKLKKTTPDGDRRQCFLFILLNKSIF